MASRNVHRVVRACLAAWLCVVTTGAWAAGSPPSTPPARDRAGSFPASTEAGGSAVLLSKLARDEAELARRQAGAGEDEAAARSLAEAARHGLAAYVAMRTAAPLCSDGSSPDEYLRELGVALAPVLGWLASQDVATRRDVTQAALALDQRTNDPARPDPLLCRRGVHGDRFCAPDMPAGECDADAAPVAEFTTSDAIAGHQRRMRTRARREVEALAR